MKRHGGLNTEVLGFPAFGHGPWPVYDNFRDGYITLFNPSAMKGIGVFIDLAHQLPGRRFAAVPTWATTQTDLDALTDIPNVDLLPTLTQCRRPASQDLCPPDAIIDRKHVGPNNRGNAPRHPGGR